MRTLQNRERRVGQYNITTSEFDILSMGVIGMREYIIKQIESSVLVKRNILDNGLLLESVERVAAAAVATYRSGGKIVLAGNGGSAADAQHIAGELVSRFYFDRPPLSAIALTTDSSVVTAIGNDYGYNQVFVRQVQANVSRNDMFIGISTSGNSQNIVEAVKYCAGHSISTVALTGYSGGELAKLCTHSICVPSFETPRIQEAHIMLGHIICSIIEEELFGKGF